MEVPWFPFRLEGTSSILRAGQCREVEDVMEAKNGKLDGVLLFVGGGLLGAGLALLFAPQSGRRTRRDIVHLGKMAKKKSEQIQLEMGHAIDSLADDISEKMQEGMDRGREWTEKTTQGVLQALNSGKDYIRRELENVMSRGA
jgi:gas vesicle protein